MNIWALTEKRKKREATIRYSSGVLSFSSGKWFPGFFFGVRVWIGLMCRLFLGGFKHQLVVHISHRPLTRIFRNSSWVLLLVGPEKQWCSRQKVQREAWASIPDPKYCMSHSCDALLTVQATVHGEMSESPSSFTDFSLYDFLPRTMYLTSSEPTVMLTHDVLVYFLPFFFLPIKLQSSKLDTFEHHLSTAIRKIQTNINELKRHWHFCF